MNESHRAADLNSVMKCLFNEVRLNLWNKVHQSVKTTLKDF